MMINLSTYSIFVTASLVLLITPGPAVLYIVMRSIDQGRIAGVVSALGVGFGTMFHVIAAALGLSTILVSSALAFSIVKYLGAVYLIYLGIRKFVEKTPSLTMQDTSSQSLKHVFQQGMIVSILNPKTALFFFAFLPQFVDPTRSAVALQVILLGLTFVSLGIVSDNLYVFVAGTVRGVLQHSKTFLYGQKYLTGAIYITLGLITAVGGKENTSPA